MTRAVASVLLLCGTLLSMAHVGSPDTFFAGMAGPYPVRVTVRLPGVIPGLAQISVRVPGVPADAVASVAVQAIQWNVGPDGAPPPDIAQRVAGDAELYAADLWFMQPTSYRVHVRIDGRDGPGTAVVPVLALATAQREMSRGLGALLAALGLFLGAGLLTIVAAAVRESVVPPGDEPPPARRRRARVAIGVGALVLVVIVVGGRAWWDAEAFAYGESVLFRPFATTASVREHGPARVLTLAIRDRRWPPAPGLLTRYNALMPDHGKLMHMFLVREPGLDAFAHVHPVPQQASAEAFDVTLPPLPAGRYRVYGDIVHESGYAQTLVAHVDIDAPTPAASAGHAGSRPPDPDDAWFDGAATPHDAAPVSRAADGMTVEFIRGPAPVAAREERLLTFRARDASGAPVVLEPYMGMLGHVVVAHADGSVFAHLHPSGSISMAALQKFTQTMDAHALHRAVSSGGEVTTPYAFPKPGRYRLWVQMKRHGEVVTRAFEIDVS